MYRRYRPDSFADVIGQEHVTEPLMTALRKNRVNHAYLFSGPRGCGKTTSARILARCLNCAEGPTDTPCGKCPSCIELARGGSGSLDVIEIDAASHGGVDDARDLRERATFAPVRDRYKIFIIDEAHMVTSAGFNALLKIVEEPPEHIKFIFATTEPDKVIGTIRSRTHHYPFRLVPPEPLMQYLELLCQQENVPVAPGVLSLVIRAGGGSVRDTLSVLDQLMAGAGSNGLDYELAVALLGYTHASLLDDIVDAVAASDAAVVFKAVDRVIQTGHDPRRFVEDLLERFRDLIIVQAMPESAQAILRGMPADQIARMRNQATNLGAAELSRAADVTNTALTEMTGATSPRLHLELLCARILLPSAEQTERGIAARIDRVERRLNYAADGGTPAVAAAAPAEDRPAASAAPSPTAVTREPMTPPRVSTNDWPVEDRPAAGRPQQAAPSDAAPRQQQQAPTQQAPTQQAPTQQAPEQHAPAQQAPPVQQSPAQQAPPVQHPPAQQAPRVQQPAAQTAQEAAPQPAVNAAPHTAAPGAGGDVEALRRAWPDVLQALTKIKRSTWALVEPNAQVAHFDGQVLTLAFTTGGLAGAFGRADHSENLRRAIHKTLGIDCQIIAVAGGNSSASSEPNPKAPTSRETPATPAATTTPAAAATAAVTTTAPAAGVTTTAPAAASDPAPVSSVDSAWGLAPAATATATPAANPAPAAPAETTTPAVAPSTPEPVQATPEPVQATPEPLRATPEPVQAEAPAAEAAQSFAPAASNSGDYSYPDDDWGPPLDEDAPPLDEEPPADWEPPAGYGSGNSQQPEPAEARPSAAKAPTPPQPKAGTQTVDPWSRAVEQAPGTWVVGSESNVGKPAEPQEPVSTEYKDAPDYEPAAAQVPSAVQVPAPAHTIDAAHTTDAAHTPEAIPSVPAPRVPSTTTAPPVWPSLAAPAEERQGSVATLEEGPPSGSPNGRQSLYQRLTNSPEAQAGRVQAPVRTQSAPAAAAEDIPSPEDETIEESRVFGRAAVERILGGKLIEERALDGSPLQPR
nr:DNA polymerase III subunit gamma and tau [Paenarthrobacter ilicis]